MLKAKVLFMIIAFVMIMGGHKEDSTQTVPKNPVSTLMLSDSTRIKKDSVICELHEMIENATKAVKKLKKECDKHCKSKKETEYE